MQVDDTAIPELQWHCRAPPTNSPCTSFWKNRLSTASSRTPVAKGKISDMVGSRRSAELRPQKPFAPALVTRPEWRVFCWPQPRDTPTPHVERHAGLDRLRDVGRPSNPLPHRMREGVSPAHAPRRALPVAQTVGLGVDGVRSRRRHPVLIP